MINILWLILFIIGCWIAFLMLSWTFYGLIFAQFDKNGDIGLFLVSITVLPFVWTYKKIKALIDWAKPDVE